MHGGLIKELGSSVKTKTGKWRNYRPVIDMERCIDCGNCWIFCPDDSIKIKRSRNEVVYEVDLEYCKGCGICASECPYGAIEMVLEGK